MQAIAPTSIADLARLADVEVATILSYENMGLLHGPSRKRGRPGSAAYNQEHLDRLMFIGRALKAGFSLDLMPQLIGLSGGLRTCNDVARLAERQLKDLRSHIVTLQGMEEKLSKLLEKCARTGPGADCSILNALRSEPDGADD
jgi:DNA-binding transcriptional MerR regulator